MKAGPLQLRKRLGNMLRELRAQNDWTQEELVTHLRKAGFGRCTRSLISQIEIGAASIRGEEIYFLRDVFGEEFERGFWNPFYNRTNSEGRKENAS